jgi:hypothetical protein
MSLKGKLKLALVFIIIMCASFIPQWFPDLFGDWTCKGGLSCNELNCGFEGRPPRHHYGFRHWVFIIMGVTFTIISLVEVVDGEKID